MHISEYVRKLLTIWIQIKQGLPYFNKLLEYLVYVKEATLPFKMQILRDCSTTGQSAFNARVLSVFWGCLYREEMSASTFSFFLFFLMALNFCLKKHLSSNSKWFLYHVVFWNVNAENEVLFATKSKDDSFIFSSITFITKEFPV